MSASITAARTANQAAAYEPTSTSPEGSTSRGNARSGAQTQPGLHLAILDSTARQHHFARQHRFNASADAANTPVEDTALSSVERAFRAQFSEAAQDPETFHTLMRESFGEGYDFQAAETIRLQALAGDFSWMPRVEFVDPQVLGGGNGAYDAANDRILLRADLKDSDLALTVFAEEVGHALDARLNSSDTAGDEGELFQKLLAGENPDQAERLQMLSDNDHGQIVVDGKQVAVEFSWWSENITDPWNEHVVDPIDEHVVQPLVTLAEDGVDIVTDIVKWPIDFVQTGVVGAGNFFSAVFDGDWSGAWDALVDTSIDLAVSPLQQGLNTTIQVLHGGFVFIEAVWGQTEQRDLTEDEIARLRPIYGDSIDYSKVQIHTGGIRESAGMGAHAVGNDIFMPDNLFDGDGNFTAEGAKTFTHEFGHIWQYQNRGADYLSSALYYQNTEGSGGVGTGEAYDWVASADQGEHFDDMNVESQAELAAFIGLSIDPVTGELDRDLLQAAIRNVSADDVYDDTYIVSDELFGIVQEAHDILRRG